MFSRVEHGSPDRDRRRLAFGAKTVGSSIAREAGVLQQWRQFAQARQSADLGTVMGSRFWQTSVMLTTVRKYRHVRVSDPGRLIDGDLELVLVEKYPGDPTINYVPAYLIQDDTWLVRIKKSVVSNSELAIRTI